MDTRRMPGSIEAAPGSLAQRHETDLEIVELSSATHDRPRRGHAWRAGFALAIAVLVGLIAIAGIPSSSGPGLDDPLPNLLAQPMNP